MFEHPDQEVETDYLEFLRDEGLELIEAYRRIKNAEKRKLVIQIIRAFAETSHDEAS